LLRTVGPRHASVHVGLDALLALLDVGDCLILGLEVLGATFACYVEAQELGLVEVDLGREDNVLVVGLEENVGQRGAEVGSIKSISALGNVHLFALGAIDLDSILTKLVAEGVGHHSLLVTEGARTVPVSTLQVLSVDQRQTYQLTHQLLHGKSCLALAYLRGTGCTLRAAGRTSPTCRYSGSRTARSAALLPWGHTLCASEPCTRPCASSRTAALPAQAS